MRTSRFGHGRSRLQAMHEAGYPDGVVLDPTPVTAGEEVTVLYNGLLSKDGADQVFLHYGYGRHNNWQAIADIQMDRTGWGWVGSLFMPPGEGRFNFCFKDSAANWDNNNGTNWSFAIHDGSPDC